MVNRWRFLALGSFGITALAMAPVINAIAQPDWPQKPVKIVVPYAPGGSADTLGRMVSLHLSEKFKQPFVIENRSGAGGIIGSQQVARSAPDGYTLVVSGIGSHVIAPINARNAFDPMQDFTHIAMLGGPPIVLAVNSTVPVYDLKGFIAYVKAQPNGVSWGSPGQGTHAHLIGEVFKANNQLNLVHISYKGAGQAVADLVGNQIPVAFMTLNSANPHIKSGKLRALAVSSEKRLANHPTVPTFAQLGYPKLTATTWFALSGPAGLPKPIVDILNTEVRKAFNQADVQTQFAKEGIETSDTDAPMFTQFVKQEIDYWTPYVKALPKDKSSTN